MSLSTKASGVSQNILTSEEINNFYKKAYPVGAIYMNVGTNNPNTLFPDTTWVKIENRSILGVGDTYTTASATGGAETHTITENTMPSHSHTVPCYNCGQEAKGYGCRQGSSAGAFNNRMVVLTANAYQVGILKNKGSGSSHSNMPPYFTVNIWRRTA